MFLKNGFNVDPDRPNLYFLKDAISGKILRTASPPNQDEFAPQFWFVSDLKGRKVYLEVVDNDNDQAKNDGYAWIGIDSLTQSE